MKRFEISYNPYTNRIHFRVAIPVDEESVTDWQELLPESSFMDYQNEECIFEDNANRILDLINNYINTTEHLEIVFKGTTEDFDILQNAVYVCSDSRAKRISCIHTETYLSSGVALERLKRAFSRAEPEFDWYFDSDEADKKEISDAVCKYKETVNPEIQICVIGPNGVGKSALINAFIGQEILPSQSYSKTAINTIVHNADEYKMEFDYLQESYEIKLDGNGYSIRKPKNPNKELISLLFSGCEKCSNEQELLYYALDKLNNTANAGLINSISIFVPYISSKLDIENYPFCFIDSPVNVNENEGNPIILLDELVTNQTNALAVVVVTRDALNSNEALDLKKLIDELGEGFTKPNSIIAVSMSDVLDTVQIKEEIPDSVREGIANPTIMYVSPVVALGSKKEEPAKWVDKEYKDIFDKNSNDLLKLNPPANNLAPSGRKVSQIEKGKRGRLLFASGVPSLEQEINYYAKCFADYKKCTQGQGILLDAINKLIVEIKISKSQAEKKLKTDQYKRIKENTAFRDEFSGIINQVKRPEIKEAVLPIISQFVSVLEEYCSGVPDTVRYYWGNIHVRPYTAENLVKDMQQHCQENLYDKNSESIKTALQSRVLELASNYMSRLKESIDEKNEYLSVGVQKSIAELFESENHKLKLDDVDAQPFDVVGFNVFKRLGSDERTVSNYSNEFIYKLKTNNTNLGKFDKQCIVDPAKAYFIQLNHWIDNLISVINKAAETDAAILNRLDNDIKELEVEINDLDDRLNNLSNVRDTLAELIPTE